MRLGCASLLSLAITGCGTAKLDAQIEKDLVEVAAMPSCAAAAPAKVEMHTYGLDGAVFSAELKLNKACRNEWWDRMQGGRMTCKTGIEWAKCSIGEVSPQGSAGFMVMPRQDDMLIVIRYAPIIMAGQSR